MVDNERRARELLMRCGVDISREGPVSVADTAFMLSREGPVSVADVALMLDEAEARGRAAALVRLNRRTKMHYRNGREAKNGDRVIRFSFEGGRIEAVGVLHDATPGNDYCNGMIAPTASMPMGACIIDCIHEDDLAALLAEKGLDKRPAGK